MNEYHLLNVLVIDDEQLFSATLVKMLGHFGVKNIQVADNGNTAMAHLERQAFDLILCDLNMPGKDGVETMRVLAERSVRSAILLLSGSDTRLLKTAEQLGRKRKLNVVAALAKPLKLAELESVLQQAKLRLSPHQSTQLEMAQVLDLERGLRAQEFVLHYQPQLSLDGCDLAGAEALIRWNHPERGLVPPDAFIPVAEQCGLIEPLTDWVVQAAIAQCALWHEKNLPLGVSINVSASTMRKLDFPDRLLNAVQGAGLSPEMLTLEVTESGVSGDLEALLDIATRLRLKGFPLSIDDFGTGFSSLAQLRRLPFTELKLDRSFVMGAAGDADTKNLLLSSVELAKRLKLKTVAEGIEDRAEWDIVKSLGVDLGQGFYMGRPMAAEDLELWIPRWRAKVA